MVWTLQESWTKIQTAGKEILAKFDATAPPEFEFKGFPTIFFVAAGELNDVVKYEGGREVGDFSTFLEERAVFSLGTKSTKEPWWTIAAFAMAKINELSNLLWVDVLSLVFF